MLSKSSALSSQQELGLIYKSCVSIHSAGPLSSITSNTNEASGPPPPRRSFLLHPPDFPLPPSLILAVLARGLRLGGAYELMKMQQVPSVGRKGWRTKSDSKRETEMEV